MVPWMPAPRLSPALSVGLLFILLLGIGLVLGLMGSAVLIPQGGAIGVLIVGALLFLGVQLMMFRLFGLRSAADERPEEPAEKDEDPDWRAWRG